jgi:hypothetical protein
MESLARRMETRIIERFNGNKRLALLHVQDKRTEWAMKCHQHRGHVMFSSYRKIWRAYQSIELSISYWFEMEVELLHDFPE